MKLLNAKCITAVKEVHKFDSAQTSLIDKYPMCLLAYIDIDSHDGEDDYGWDFLGDVTIEFLSIQVPFDSVKGLVMVQVVETTESHMLINYDGSWDDNLNIPEWLNPCNKQTGLIRIYELFGRSFPLEENKLFIYIIITIMRIDGEKAGGESVSDFDDASLSLSLVMNQMVHYSYLFTN
jgi:hypothetical protein